MYHVWRLNRLGEWEHFGMTASLDVARGFAVLPDFEFTGW